MHLPHGPGVFHTGTDTFCKIRYINALTSFRQTLRPAGADPEDSVRETIRDRSYPDLSEGKPGMLGAVTSRAEAPRR